MEIPRHVRRRRCVARGSAVPDIGDHGFVRGGVRSHTYGIINTGGSIQCNSICRRPMTRYSLARGGYHQPRRTAIVSHRRIHTADETASCCLESQPPYIHPYIYLVISKFYVLFGRLISPLSSEDRGVCPCLPACLPACLPNYGKSRLPRLYAWRKTDKSPGYLQRRTAPHRTAPYRST